MTQSTSVYEVDILILGGGIAGLWCLNLLRKLNYQVLLLEPKALGTGQTLASQGIIHGGLKYALQGILSASSRQIASMPGRWQACLDGQGEIDLSQTETLSPHQYLWSSKSLSAKIAGFFASKATASPAFLLAPKDYPTFLNHPNFKGQIYQLQERVLNVPSLLENLRLNHAPYILQVDHLSLGPDSAQAQVSCTLAGERVEFKAQRCVLTAGAGNQTLLGEDTSLMQKRPLHMVMLAHDYGPFYGHAVCAQMNPRLTISSHPLNDKTVFYLGGQLAEDGVNRSREAQILASQTELAALFPWHDWTRPRFETLFIDRAESFEQGVRPEGPCIKTRGSHYICWPTKLALSPQLGDQLQALLKQESVLPNAKAFHPPAHWPLAQVGQTPWKQAFNA